MADKENGKEEVMATESFGKIVYLDNDMADRIIAAQERMRANPPKPSTHKPKWATDEDRKRIAESLRRKYGHE